MLIKQNETFNATCLQIAARDKVQLNIQKLRFKAAVKLILKHVDELMTPEALTHSFAVD